VSVVGAPPPAAPAPAALAGSPLQLVRRAILGQGVLLTIAWLAVIVAFTSQLPFFLTFTNAVTVLNFSAVTFIAAAGFTIVLIGGGLDLSVGSTVMVSGVAAGMLFLSGLPAVPAFMLGFATGPLIGLVNGVLITRLRINPLIATLSMLFVLRGVGYLVAGSQLRQVRDPGFRFAREFLFGVPIAVYVLAAVFVATWAVLRFTKFGQHLQAVGANPAAARQAALKVDRFRTLMYVVAGAYSGLAGILLASILGAADPNSGTGREFSIATAVFLGGASLSGGRGSVVGTLIGVLFITTLSNGMTQLGALPEIVLIVDGALLVAAVAFDQRPKGGYR
jgi:ribose/xylose/arabinose/galactoside ABC-type transport system permease subunit